jgi:hypothetical protein
MSAVGKLDTSSSFACKAYAPRPAQSRAVIHQSNWTIKPYSILGRDSAADLFDPHALAVIEATLPEPARTKSRPGVAFVIHHIATPLDYLVVCWWDNENELLTRVLTRNAAAATRDPATPFRLSERESFCVWDMDIMWHERAAYVRHVLAGLRGGVVSGDLNDYAADRFEKPQVG